jgi:hypothetical protein
MLRFDSRGNVNDLGRYIDGRAIEPGIGRFESPFLISQLEISNGCINDGAKIPLWTSLSGIFLSMTECHN